MTEPQGEEWLHVLLVLLLVIFLIGLLLFVFGVIEGVQFPKLTSITPSPLLSDGRSLRVQ